LAEGFPSGMDSLRGSFAKLGAVQGRSAWSLCKDDTHKSRSENKSLAEGFSRSRSGTPISVAYRQNPNSRVVKADCHDGKLGRPKQAS